MQKRTSFILGLLVGALLVGAAGTATYYGWVRPRHVNEMQVLKKNYAAENSSLRRRAKGLRKTATSAIPAPQNTNIDRLTPASEAALNKKLQAEQFIGTVLLVQHGQIILNKGYGYADAVTKRKNTAASLYQIGSVQKSITAVLIAQLIASGQAKYTDNLHLYYPQIPASDGITLRHMLNMASGLAYTAPAPKTVLTDNQLLAYVLQRVTFNPAKLGHRDYQPVNFTLLAGIVEQLTHQSYEQVVNQRIFAPLGLKANDAGFQWHMIEQPSETVSYGTKPNAGLYAQPVAQTLADMHSELGTGNIYATSNALYQIEKATVDGKLLSAAQVKTLRNSSNGVYGGGAYNFADYYVSHGVKNNQEVVFAMAKDGQTAAILMTNRASAYLQWEDWQKWYYRFAQNAATD
ncbi:serine hydrolase domain-containing protein [Schleiferilactobacillus shenzhenensis]|uniref:D-alanyl-D-alanine carboxypeptidase n=1 Tax=Schleiferilactobacillus shenzhenensis LY-73 TaxID=1231336 RepID=U4TSV8_9LACO|nr:serine hydrolase domain-containing protein [Schleiferilactobacillus shenzhenensis]ERL64562.1 D-alanyl-D-alanine carboxypeptidase [Schleiferilactobacillus shenzhenensis LY-73]